MSERCGHLMVRAQVPCVLRPGHCDAHRAVPKNGPNASTSQSRYRQTPAGQAANDRYVKSEKGREAYRRSIESGRAAAAKAKYRRRRADERDETIDTRLETLLGGLIAPSKP